MILNMRWFFIALIGPILYAFANHTDKYLISRYFKNGEVGALIIFSSIFSIIALPIVLFIHPTVFNVSFFQGVVLAINSMLGGQLAGTDEALGALVKKKWEKI